METFFYFIGVVLILTIIYDKYIQKEHQLLINYPVIGRLRYLFETIREPFRQYFGSEDFHGSRDRVEWVYKAAHDQHSFASFAPKQPLPLPKFLLKHSNIPLNKDEVSEDIGITYGVNQKDPFYAKSIISRSAMSDGSLSPEATQSFTMGAKLGDFPINTGEGGLTSNFFITHKNYDAKYMEVINIPMFHKFCFILVKNVFRNAVAQRFVKYCVLPNNVADTYLFDDKNICFYRPNWNSNVEDFPSNVPEDMPDIIYQISSGLYGSRDKDGNFDPVSYEKSMKFCRMTEIKIAQGAKQTGGKLIGSKVTEAIAYYRGVEPYKDLFSPNRFPYANSVEELFNFIGELQNISNKPVGIKIVISDKDNIEPYAKEIKRRVSLGHINGVPDFITLDGGDGGSATAPISLMERVGLHVKEAIFIVDNVLKKYEVRDRIKIIASGKILTPDDVVIALSLGANGRHCPVGMATQDKKARASYLVKRNSLHISNYHKSLKYGIQEILAVMGLHSIDELDRDHLKLIDTDGKVCNNVNRILEQQLHA